MLHNCCQAQSCVKEGMDGPSLTIKSVPYMQRTRLIPIFGVLAKGVHYKHPSILTGH